ncbi:hypothetical protein ACFE04_009217 [Oxalis oulophora]
MHSIKGGWVGQTFALAKHNESEGRKTRIRRSKEERKDMVVVFIKKYQKLNDGKFPSLSLTHRECGGSFYTIREIVREVIQENRVLGPAKLTPEEKDNAQLFEQFPVGTIATGPQSSSFASSNGYINHNQVASEESVLNSDSLRVGLANSSSQEQETDQISEQMTVTIPILPEDHFSLSSNGLQSLSDQTLITEEPLSNSNGVILEATTLSLKSEMEVTGSVVDVKIVESSNINLTDKQINPLSDSVLEEEYQRFESKKEVTKNVLDVEIEESSKIISEESQTDEQVKPLSDSVVLEEEPLSLKSINEANGTIVGVKIEESSNSSSANSQSGKQAEDGERFEHLAESRAKITDITENVTVETFPIIKPVTEPVNGKSGELGEVTPDGNSGVHDNRKLYANGVVTSDAFKKREVTNTSSGSSSKISATQATKKVVLARPADFLVDKNLFTPKAYLTRYWSQTIKSNVPQSEFLLSKASPLTAIDSATFTKLAEQNKISTQLPRFCSAAKLLCFPDLLPSLEKHSPNSSFSVYQEHNFTNYGTNGFGRANSFKNYSDDQSLAINSFKEYSRNSVNQDAEFSSYSPTVNMADQSFNSYGNGERTIDGKSDFNNYEQQVNVGNLKFNNYGSDAVMRNQSFKTYTAHSNSGNEIFTSYGKKGIKVTSEFQKYAEESNVMLSNFANYAEKGSDANDTFTSYGFDGNNPGNDFKKYGEKGDSVKDTFVSYHGETNAGRSSFESYGKKSLSDEENFINYKGGSNGGGSHFTGYGKESRGKKVGFQTYSVDDTFKEYEDNHTISFAGYAHNDSSLVNHVARVNKWVEPGKFFRESMLKQGNVMPMPDIRDKMPTRPFLPRAILSKLPFSTARLGEMKKIFHAKENSTMEKIIVESLHECERAPSEGETKRCAGSAEDMIDFVTSVLGNNVVVWTTENTNGYNKNITIGSVKGINGGNVTKSVSCHQSLYPYLLYYCHSVPKVKVYTADILDAKSKEKINEGTAICHLDTSSWSPTHGAFLALGSSPGKIEVCHWIFENDMTWTVDDLYT